MSTTRPTREDLLKAIDAMAGVRVLVVADLVLDVFEYGEIGRVSREAPVLILNHVKSERLPGGGANSAANLRALDGAPVVVGRVGEDEAGEQLLALFRERGIEAGGVWRDPFYRTPVKQRILGGSAHSVKQQIVRMDRGGGPPVDAGFTPFLEAVRAAAGATQGALVSDYNFGLVHAATAPALLTTLAVARAPLFVDSRSQMRLFRRITAATPNLQEAEAILGESLHDDDPAIARGGAALLRALEAEAVVVTRGSHGMSLFTSDGSVRHLPVFGTDEVADVTGAGDTVISTFTLAVLSGSGYLVAALLSNYAGGIVVMKRGTATVSREELTRAVRDDPDFDLRLGHA
jgi:rfaE bifunctional protein kinase chain/domain